MVINSVLMVILLPYIVLILHCTKGLHLKIEQISNEEIYFINNYNWMLNYGKCREPYEIDHKRGKS